ncbi:unnamed protein product [Nippostrongylus brasiliensis]|uniref:L-Fucosyltransferase n=1 Tax=Nippostrongylus brasiliensis TaxID=27835 RepID=A0A0N4Y9A0_NIPBR|nr:unnamed protein product [Nippostrongylus brasiliensis]
MSDEDVCQSVVKFRVVSVTLLTFGLFCYVRLWTWNSIPHDQVAPQKYVGFSLSWGRMGNQLFHLITGYGIARSLGRVHYIPYSTLLAHVNRYLIEFDRIFPELRKSYIIMPDYLDDVRQLLRFSSAITKEGDYQLRALDVPLNSTLCIHIRRGDFVDMKVDTNVNETIRAVNDISGRMGTSRFMIFGDDQEFMRNLSHLIISSQNISEDAVLISNFSEAMDLYLSSRLCNSFLITAATSTFGWWLAFFIEDQNAVYYLLDNRTHDDKIPSKELFL